MNEQAPKTDRSEATVIEARFLTLEDFSKILGYEIKTGPNELKSMRREDFIDFGEGKIFEGNILVLDRKVQLLIEEKEDKRGPRPIDLNEKVAVIDHDIIHFVSPLEKETGTYRQLYDWMTIGHNKAFARSSKYVNPGNEWMTVRDITLEIHSAAQIATRLKKAS